MEKILTKARKVYAACLDLEKVHERTDLGSNVRCWGIQSGWKATIHMESKHFIKMLILVLRLPDKWVKVSEYIHEDIRKMK